MKSYLAINLNDFHSNQNNNAETNTRIKFIAANNLDSARKFIHESDLCNAWVVIPKQYFDKNIVRVNN